MEEEGERDIVTAFREYCFDKSEKRTKACAKRPGADATQGNEGIRRLIAGVLLFEGNQSTRRGRDDSKHSKVRVYRPLIGRVSNLAHV